MASPPTRAAQRRLVAGLAAAAMLAGLTAGGSGGASAATVPPATITVGPTVVGTAPTVLGYNIGHSMAGSNAADWWRYSGAQAARVFVSASDIEGTDDLSPVGDGVASRAGFTSRAAALRSNAANPAVALSSTYVKWSAFEAAYRQVATGNNRFVVSDLFPAMRASGVEILVNITASPTRFPLVDVNDHANMWELWQHYYAQAYVLSRDYGVRRFSVFNEPNGWAGLTVDNWALRVRVCSDAVKAAVADMNARYGRTVVPEVLAPNTANGATKYDDAAAGDTWGSTAVAQRSWDIWGTPTAGRANFDVYNYQRYSMNATATSTSTGYAEDYDDLRAAIDADTGPGVLPLALTEYNVRTGDNYDTRPETGDSPSDYAALGANSIVLAERGARQLYLFKFGMTARTGTTSYPVAKNGTHYVNNSTSGVNPYGGAAATAEVYRLFIKASGAARSRLATTSTLGGEVFVQTTREAVGGPVHVFITNRGTTPAPVELDLSALSLPDGALVTVEEVSQTARGGVVRTSALSAGRVSAGSMPGQSVWLVSVRPGIAASPSRITAAADSALGDGTGRTTTGGSATTLTVRADGSANGRKAAVIRFAVPTGWSPGQRVLLSLSAGTTAGTTPVVTHVYGLDDDQWTESTVTYASLTSALRQGIGAGTLIANNVVANQGSRTFVLGQLLADSTTRSERLVDVTDFVTRQSDGQASFLLVQDHRWDVRLPEKTAGDLQPAGLSVASRETASAPALLVHGAPPVVVAPTVTSQPVAQSATVGGSATFSVTASGTGPLAYQWRKDGTPMTGATAPSLTLTNLALTDAGTYSVVVSNSAGSATSSGAALSVTAPVATPVAAEFESLAVAARSGDSVGIKSDSLASGGKSVLYRSNAIGDFITFRLNVPRPGTYTVAVTAKMQGDRGRFQLSVADSLTGAYTPIDTPKDEYRSSITFGSVGAFTQRVTFATGGDKFLRMSVTGRSASASGYTLNFDRITLTP